MNPLNGKTSNRLTFWQKGTSISNRNDEFPLIGKAGKPPLSHKWSQHGVRCLISLLARTPPDLSYWTTSQPSLALGEHRTARLRSPLPINQAAKQVSLHSIISITPFKEKHSCGNTKGRRETISEVRDLVKGGNSPAWSVLFCFDVSNLNITKLI